MEPYQRLESEIGDWAGFPPENVVACSSGTAALHLALEAMRLRPGTGVIVPDYTMVACPRAVVMAGLRPVFVDCDERLLMSEKRYDEYLADPANNVHGRLSTVMFVHVYGRRVDVDKMGQWVFDVGANVIEDLAEAHGVKPSPWTDAACWSFYRNKQIHGEEGGAVAFRDGEHARLARQLRSLGFTEAHDYTHTPRGMNYRLANALALPILKSLEQFRQREPHRTAVEERRREVETWYDEACPVEWRQPRRDAVWVYDFRVPGMRPSVQDGVVRELRAAGIEARYGFKPMRRQEEWAKDWGGGFEWESDRASREVVYLPVRHGETTREDCQRAFEIVRRIVEG